ncbi:FAD-dependent oxidoreductase [Azospirillum sp. B4]|uniref:oxidoreductase n=1 Tax=Azospirillum sp. B4 TaxID=95605 RepID=UPI00131F433C|nr:FAD-dependent oxidoreductase [Azospirillum sp. B4]
MKEQLAAVTPPQEEGWAVDTAYPHLFSPIQLGHRTLRNRIVHASTTTRFQERGRVTDKLIAYHVNRARGGAALTVTEPLAVLSRQLNGVRVEVLSGVNADGLARWAAAVEAEGCGLVGQIQDPGRGRHEDGRVGRLISASALPDDLSWTVAHALTTGEVEGVIEEFVRSAGLLKAAGFAGVEVSAGHGHLFHQFLSPLSNQREDRYGGDLAGRTRLLTDLLRELRRHCGPDFLIGVKLPGEDGLPGGIGMEEAAAITALAHGTGAASYITYCWGSHADTLDWHLPDNHGPRVPYAARIAALGRSAPGTPIGALGLITDPNEGERLVRDGLADLVMLARPLVTDPAWPNKARAGREAQIRYCVSCNTCWHLIATHGTLRCDNNPRVGAEDEADWTPRRATGPARRVVVVGAGPAGLEAAWTAAARGHQVTVLGQGDEVGGKARLHAILPGGEGLSSVYDYQRLAADRHGVDFRLGAAATLDDILALDPDTVVLATGASPSWPAYLPADYRGEGYFPDVREAVALLARVTARQAGTAVVFDQDGTAFTYAATEFLAARFEKVVLATPRDRIAGAEALVNRQGIHRRLLGRGVEILPFHAPDPSSAFEEGEIILRHVLTGATRRIEDVALHTFATPRVPNTALLAPLMAAGLDVHLVGDAYAPRLLLDATSEGHGVGMLV